MTTIRRQATAGTGAAGSANGSQSVVRVLLIGDVRLYRELLATALERAEGIELAGSAPGDVASMAAGMFEPGVVVVDSACVQEPGGMRALAAALPQAKIVAVGFPTTRRGSSRCSRPASQGSSPPTSRSATSSAP